MGLSIWVTGGGTREPIDDVRFVGNRSTGSMALALVQEAVQRGHSVTCFLAESVAAESRPGVRFLRYETSQDLAMALREAEPSPEAIFHAAAVSDYAPVVAEGKVPSGQETWTLHLKPLPKLVDDLRARFPRALLVMFKLESEISRAELVSRARAAGERAGAQWVFANLLQEVGVGHAGVMVEVAGNREIPIVGRDQVAAALIRTAEDAISGAAP